MNNKLTSLLERLFSLLVVFLLLAATSLWSGQFLGIDWLKATTQVPDAAKLSEMYGELKQPDAEEMAQLGIEGMQLVQRDSISWTVQAPDKCRRGTLLSSVPVGKDIIGYNGNTPLYIFLDNSKKIQKVVAMENDETPGFFRHAAKGIMDKWDGKTVDQALALKVDAVSGATYTSQSLIGTMNATLSTYSSAGLNVHKEPVIGWGRTIALFVVFALGLLATWKFRGIRWFRLTVMALNVVVTGFWCGQFLSLNILHGWVQNGVDVILYLPTFVMLVIAILMPYLGKRNHYCLWMCPYGSLQELAFQLPIPKIKVGAKVYQAMRRIRMAVLMLLLFSLWMGFGLSILDYEPFSAFIVSTAAPAVMILAALFVVAGIFIPHPWCQCMCPVGALLNLAEDNK